MAVFHAQDHRTGSQEEQRLEESVRYQVEHGRHPRAHPAAATMKPKLADGRIGQDFLDVGLPHGDRGGKQGGQAPTQITAACAAGTRLIQRRCERTIRYTPAVTIVAAWISAETGVGPAMASGSQT